MSKTYYKRFDLRNVYVVTELLRRTYKAHAALQDIEAPEKAFETTGQMREGIAKATFGFLYALGYYPDDVVVSGQTFKVKEWSYRKSLTGDDNYFAVAHLENGGTFIIDILGPDNPNGVVLDADDIISIVNAFFPELVVQTTTGIAHSGDAVFHVSVREKFMQESFLFYSSPVPNGSAMNRASTIAIMQATMRMLTSVLLDAVAAAYYRLAPEEVRTMASRIAGRK